MAPSSHSIGILGGGQLGTFFVIAARRLGYAVTVWDPSCEAPARLWADRFINAPFSDDKARQRFTQGCEAATYEWENIPVELIESLEKEVPVRPGGRILRLLQNRISEKDFLTGRTLPTTPYRPIRKKEELHAEAESLGLPAILKTATAGYDGRGQWRLKDPADVDRLVSTLRPRPTGWILEKYVSYLKELSIVAARNEEGRVVIYAVTENAHEGGILRHCQAPASIDSSLADRISALAAEVLKALDGVGLFCIELFLLKNDVLLINEIAPRPHNSGHYSLDVVATSQFEQQARVLCGLPLARPTLYSPAVMINMLGPEIMALRPEKQMNALLEIPGAKVYDYGKRTIKPRRKMGHVTLIDPELSVLQTRAARVQAILDEAAHGYEIKTD